MRQAKYLVEVRAAKRAFRVDKELEEALKGTLSSKMISRMKREYVECPVAGKEVAFLLCYSCVSFIRRVSGVVHCEGVEFRIKSKGEGG
ncbi:MAG: hypothetical protein QXO17_05880 [Nitrososphaerota archaeon]|nr:hypothetical protein [Candidatus Calditenuis fumarioli]